MNIIILLAAVVLLTAIVLACAWQLHRKRAFTLDLANIAEGTHPNGCISKLTDAAITTRKLLYKRGSDDQHIAVCAATADVPMGTVDDEATAAEERVNVNLLGSKPGTMLMVASEAMTVGDEVWTTATGKVQDRTATSGTYWIVGIALSAAGADGDLIEVQHCAPIRVVIP